MKKWEEHSPAWRTKMAASGATASRWNAFGNLKNRKGLSQAEYARGVSVRQQRSAVSSSARKPSISSDEKLVQNLTRIAYDRPGDYIASKFSIREDRIRDNVSRMSRAQKARARKIRTNDDYMEEFEDADFWDLDGDGDPTGLWYH